MSALACDNCGKGLEDTAKENAWHGVRSHTGDVPGTGMCRECGDDPEARMARKWMGRMYVSFVDARIPVIRNALSSTDQARFDKMSYELKTAVVMHEELFKFGMDAKR